MNNLFFFIFFIFIFYFFFIASNTHTEKKQKLHRINKVIKKKQQTNKQTNSEFTHLHGNILTNIKIITAMVIPYITVLSITYN